jgi:hypothetical protein
MTFIIGIVLLLIGLFTWMVGFIGTIKSKYENTNSFRIMISGVLILNIGNILIQIGVFAK